MSTTVKMSTNTLAVERWAVVAAGRIEALEAAITELRDRIKAHPAYENLTETQELDIGGDTAELSYLARVAQDALDGK